MIDEIIERIVQFFSTGVVEKVIKALLVLCDRFVNFILSLCEGNNYKKKDETVDVLYSSGNFLVINKKHDLLINSNDTKKKTVQTIMRKQFPEYVQDNLTHDFYFAHRLDFATSGILCIPLNKNACKEVCQVFEEQRARKYYLALLRGHTDFDDEVIDIAIGEDIRFKDTSKKMCTILEDELCQNPRRSITKVLVLDRGYYNGKPVTKVLLRPITGRRHQLRLHCSQIGHVIVGDYTYSLKIDTSPPRMFLHAFRLVLPNSFENIDIQTEDPFTEKALKYKWKVVEQVNAIGTAFDLIDSF